MRPPPPRPCTARPMIMMSMPGMPRALDRGEAKPQISEPTRNTTMAAWKIGRRPRRSEILPHSGVEAVDVSR